MGTAHPNEGCALTMQARLPMTEVSGQYLVPVDIGGKNYLMVVDTGAQTALTPAAVDMMGLATDYMPTHRIAGIGTGGSRIQDNRMIPSLKLGPLEWTQLKVAMGSMFVPKQPEEQPQVVGLLGSDILSRYDIEFDFAAKQMMFYSVRNCAGWFVPWPEKYYRYAPAPVKLDYFSDILRARKFLMPVTLNGHPARAVLDTGAVRSIVTKKAARNVGLGEQERNPFLEVPVTHFSGFGEKTIPTYVYRFDTLEIGPFSFQHIPLAVVDTDLNQEDMLLGMDFMGSQRVWISYSNNLVFMQPVAPSAWQAMERSAPPVLPAPPQANP